MNRYKKEFNHNKRAFEQEVQILESKVSKLTTENVEDYRENVSRKSTFESYSDIDYGM